VRRVSTSIPLLREMRLPRTGLSPRLITTQRTAATTDAAPYATALIAAHQMRAVTDAQLARSTTTILALKARASVLFHDEEERVRREVAEAGIRATRRRAAHRARRVGPLTMNPHNAPPCCASRSAPSRLPCTTARRCAPPAGSPRRRQPPRQIGPHTPRCAPCCARGSRRC
jgi:hypothetical protein